jgi:predicted porin
VGPLSDSGGDTWADPLVGVRVILPIGKGFFANGLGDVGGGPGGDLTWQLYGGLGYNFNQTFAAYVGYRYLAMNHQDGNFLFNINQQGPLVGVGIRF